MVPGIKNFSEVAPGIFRGGQPDSRGWDHLKSLGVKTVISLRWNKSKIDWEREVVQSHGMSYVSLPLTYWDWPTEKQIQQFLAILDDKQALPVFVHCLHGSDRTGLMVAIYRLSRHDWDADRAYAEMRKHGFHRVWVYHFKWVLYDFARKLQQSHP